VIYDCAGCGEPITARVHEPGHVMVPMRTLLGRMVAHAHPGECEDRAVANASEQPARREPWPLSKAERAKGAVK
jgi:hypothetical protein